MFSLLIETSTERGCVAVFKDNHLLLHLPLPVGLQNSTFLMPQIESALRELGIKPKSLHSITVGIGPGSYTGIRVGVIVAKTMAYALNIPLIGVGTLEGFVPAFDTTFAAAIDAKIGGVYLMTGKIKEGQIIQRSSAEVCSLEHIFLQLQQVETIVTPHQELLKLKLEKAMIKTQWNWIEQGPDPLSMHRIAMKKLEQGLHAEDYRMELLYLRETQAELLRKAPKAT